MKKKIYILTLLLAPIILLNVFALTNGVINQLISSTYQVIYLFYSLMWRILSPLLYACVIFYLIFYFKEFSSHPSVLISSVFFLLWSAYNALCFFRYSMRVPFLSYPTFDQAMLCVGFGLCLTVCALVVRIRSKKNYEKNLIG